MTIKRYVDEGPAGTVVTLVDWAARRHIQRGTGCWTSDQSGGALLDLHVHDVDFAQWLLGVPDTIRARGTFGATHGIDHIIATHGYSDGRYAVIEGGWTLAPSAQFEMSIMVQGEQGALEWSTTRGTDVLLYAGGNQPEPIRCSGDALASEQRYFTECVRAGCPVQRCTPASSRLSVALTWLERRSVESGRQISLSDRLRTTWGMT